MEAKNIEDIQFIQDDTNPNNYPTYPKQFWAKHNNNQCKFGNYVSPTYLQKIKSSLKLRNNDIFLATYPRSGTTMTRRILLAMLDKKKGLKTDAMLNDDNYPGLDVASAFIEFQSQTYGGDDYRVVLD